MGTYVRYDEMYMITFEINDGYHTFRFIIGKNTLKIQEKNKFLFCFTFEISEIKSNDITVCYKDSLEIWDIVKLYKKIMAHLISPETTSDDSISLGNMKVILCEGKASGILELDYEMANTAKISVLTKANIHIQLNREDLAKLAEQMKTVYRKMRNYIYDHLPNADHEDTIWDYMLVLGVWADIEDALVLKKEEIADIEKVVDDIKEIYEQHKNIKTDSIKRICCAVKDCNNAAMIMAEIYSEMSRLQYEVKKCDTVNIVN